MKFIDVFRVRQTDSEGHPSTLVGYFSTHALAVRAAEGKGGWGGPGVIEPMTAIQLPTGQTWVLEHKDPVDLDLKQVRADETLREMVLARLTPEERRVLGLEK